MPLDPMISEAMLGTFRKMAQEIKDKNITGEDFDNMCQTLERMEELAQTHDDINAFNGQVTQENLFGQFSDHYGRCLSSQAQAASSDSADGGYDDAALLKQTLDGLRNAVKSIRNAKQEAIRQATEYDPEKAMEGNAVVRDSYVYNYEWQLANARCPLHIEKAKRKIELFVTLAEKTPFKIPNSDELNFGMQKIDYEFEPQIIKWKEITGRWEKLLWNLSFWSLSYTSVAPYLEPWSLAVDVQKAIKKQKILRREPLNKEKDCYKNTLT